MRLASCVFACFVWSQTFLGLIAGVDLLWDPPTSGLPLGYNVYRSNSADGSPILLNEQVVTTCSYTDNGAAPGNTYYYKVKSVSQCGTESQPSNQLTVSVPAPNRPPTADAGPDNTAVSGQVVTLAGAGSDPDGDPLSFAWTQLSGPSVTLSQASSSSAVFTAPLVPSQTWLVFRLSVSDGKGGSANDEVGILVTPPVVNQNPTADAGPDQNAKTGQTVILLGSATDPDGDPITYAWTQISGPVVSLSGADMPSASFIAPDIDSRSSACFKLSVTDGRGGTASDQVSVSLRPQNQKPKAFLSPTNLSNTDQDWREAHVSSAIVNWTDESHEFSASLIDQDGTERQRTMLSPTPPHGQQAFFNASLAVGDSQSSVLLIDDEERGNLKGMFAVTDNGMRKSEAISGDLRPASHLYFPLTQKRSEKSLSRLFNVNDETARVTLTLRDGNDGKILGQSVRLLARHGTLSASPFDLFPGDPAPSNAYVEVESNVPVTGFQVLAGESTYSSLAAQPAAETTELWLPHFVLGSPDLTTTLHLLNAGTSDAILVKVAAYSDDGALIVSKRLRLKPRELAVTDLTTFGTKIRNRSGYLKLTAPEAAGSIPRLVGAVQYSGNDDAFASAVSLQPGGQRRTLFPQVAQSLSEGSFTGVAVLNPSSETARVTVSSFRSDGTLNQEVLLELKPWTRVVDLLNGRAFFGSMFEQIRGYLVVSSNSPVISIMLLGDYRSTYLAAVQGEEVE